jgi:hypothetical protein
MGWASFWALGLVDGWKPLLLYFCYRRSLGLVGFGPSSKFLRLWAWSTVDGKNGPLQFLKHKTPLNNPSLKDREKLQQKSSLDILRGSSIHVYLEDHQGSIIGVLFCNWAVYKLHTIAATQQLL